MSADRRCRCCRKESDTVLSIGIAADHGGFYLKEELGTALRAEGYKVKDFGASTFDKDDDYPDFITPLAKAVASGELDRGIAVCGSGVGASIIANKVSGVRAALVHDVFSAHQGVEDDNMNILCLGGRVIGNALAADLVRTFLGARFSGAPRHKRRLAAIDALERKD
jgi:ribose 5-phosphate isomerase B